MRLLLKEPRRTRTLQLLNVVLALCGLGALALFVVLIGWPLSQEARASLRVATSCILAAFVIQQIFRLLLQPHPGAYLRAHKLENALAFVAGNELLWRETMLRWLGRIWPDLPGSTLTLFYLGGSLLTFLGFVSLRMLRRSRFFSHRRLTPGLVLTLSFAGLILAGTLLLKTPQATPAGITWTDAVFTATSAVCVTGLITVDTATAFTRLGQWIILGLFQAGGLGIMTLTYFFAHFLAGGVSLRDRIALQDLLSEENLGHVGKVLGLIIGFTFASEFIGAVVIRACLVGDGTAPDDVWFFSVFHSVSAFCNAGFSTLTGGLADPAVQGRTAFLIPIMLLITVGGLGFPVLKNLWDTALAKLRRRLGLTQAIAPRITANTRVVLITSAWLVFGGAAAIYLTEFAFASGVERSSGALTALFHSVTARTAGFNITPVEALTPATVTLVMFLMFVGGSPSSTAGGVKTSTVAIAVLALRRIVFGRRDIEAFGRRFGDEIGNRALAILMLAIAFITMITVVLCALHPELPPSDIAFEAVSAVGTVGLSRGITAQLGDPAKLTLVVAMLVGRVGVLAFVLAFVPRRSPSGYRLPETGIVIS